MFVSYFTAECHCQNIVVWSAKERPFRLPLRGLRPGEVDGDGDRWWAPGGRRAATPPPTVSGDAAQGTPRPSGRQGASIVPSGAGRPRLVARSQRRATASPPRARGDEQ